MICGSAHNSQSSGAGSGPAPGALGGRVTYLLRRVTDAAGRLANAHLVPLGIDTRQYTVLTVVAAGGGSSQRSIADTLGLDRATVVALVDRLENLGLVRRIRSREDRRANAVEVTPKGHRLRKRADALMEQCERAFVAGLPPNERERLARILEQLLAANPRE